MQLLAAQSAGDTIASKLDRDVILMAVYADDSSKPPIFEANGNLARVPLHKESKERKRKDFVYQYAVTTLKKRAVSPMTKGTNRIYAPGSEKHDKVLCLQRRQGTSSLTLQREIFFPMGTGSLFGVAGELPEVYTQAITAGTGASGFIVSMLRCITKVGNARRVTNRTVRSLSNLDNRTWGAGINFVFTWGLMPWRPCQEPD
jgi:hypothetical protein